MESMHRIRILLVDDEPHILQFLELGLQNEGFEVRTAPDGECAIMEANRFEPHIIVLDVMMPGIDGLAVCRRLKEEGRDVAIIMLTAKDEIDDRVKGLMIGADDYMAKPFSFEELLARIQARLRNQFRACWENSSLAHSPSMTARKKLHTKGRLLSCHPRSINCLNCL